MGSKFPLIRKIVAAAVVGGALVLGSAGSAGASTLAQTAPSGASAATAQLTPGAKDRLAHFSCTRATRALKRIHRAEAGIAAGLPRLHAAEAKAKATGHTRKAARIGKLITRLGRPGAADRLQHLAAAIEAKCGVAVPATVPAKVS